MSSWSTNLKIELLGTGDTNWGNLTNDNFKWAIEESITGYGTATFPSDADYDWGALYTNSNSSQAQRNLVVRVAGTISTTRNLVVPTIEKQYIIWNDTTGSQAIVVKTSAGTGVTIPNGVRMQVFVDGTNVVQMSNYDVSRTIGTLSLTNALSAANGGTGVTSLGTGVAVALGQNVTGSGGIVLATSPVLTTPNLGTPSAATLTNATGLPISTGVSGLGTSVATALAVNVGSSGAFVVNGGALGTPSSGTLTNVTGLPLTTGVTGTLPVANGGTGITAFGTGVATALGQNVTGSGGIVLATSPTLSGSPTAPTQAAGTNNTTVATTAFVQAALNALYPVGSIYINATNATNPGTLLGFGTWTAFGAGRVPVGYNASDPLFDSAEETGGSKDAVVVSHTHTYSATEVAGPSGTSINYISANNLNYYDTGVSVSPAVNFTINSAGVSGTNANIQPYITVYMWKRTA